MLARRLGCCNPYPVRGITFQMSSAYSRIARSEENQPTCAVFSTLDRHQARRSRQRAETSACLAAKAAKGKDYSVREKWEA